MDNDYTVMNMRIDGVPVIVFKRESVNLKFWNLCQEFGYSVIECKTDFNYPFRIICTEKDFITLREMSKV